MHKLHHYLQDLGTFTVGGSITPSHHETTSTVTYTAPVEPNVDVDPRAVSALDNYFSQFKLQELVARIPISERIDFANRKADFARWRQGRILQNLGTFTVGGSITPSHHKSTSTVTYTPPADVNVDIDPRFN